MKAKSLIIILTLIANFSFGQQSEIHEAAKAGDLEKVKTLLEAKPDLLELKDNIGRTPLYIASNSQRLAMAKYLIHKGADVSTRNNYGWTPLLSVSIEGDLDVDFIQLIIAKGADVNAKLGNGLTSLHFAAMGGNLKTTRLLINHGANLNAIDRGNYGTILHTAINNDSPFVVGEKQEEIAELLIECGAKLNRKYIYGNTEIHLAAAKGYANTISVLAKHGADVNAVNDDNHTALYYAAKLGYRSTAEALIAAGADQNAIAETNYGKPKQLTEPLKEGEAYLWHLGGIWRCGYAVKTKENLLIFDKLKMDESPEAGLTNGKLNPEELAGQKLTLLITKTLFGSQMPALFDLHRSRFVELTKRMPDIDWIIESQPTDGDSNTLSIPPYHAADSHKSFSVDGIKVHTIPALACAYGGVKGLGYLVEVDGLKILHAGFHASQNQASQLEEYRQEIDYLKPFGPVDIAFLPVNSHLWGISYDAYHYLIDQLQPKAIYLMGGRSEEYKKCADVLRARNIPVAYPEAAIAIGERFHFTRKTE